jgi:hypothetical protein
LFLLFFWLRHWGYVSFRTGKNDDISNPSGGAGAGIYDGFSETQTDSQVSAITHLEFNGFLHYCYLMCLNLGFKHIFSPWVFTTLFFSLWVSNCITDGTSILGKDRIDTSVKFSVKKLTVCYVSTSEVDTWHYIKKLKIFKN